MPIIITVGPKNAYILLYVRNCNRAPTKGFVCPAAMAISLCLISTSDVGLPCYLKWIHFSERLSHPQCASIYTVMPGVVFF